MVDRPTACEAIARQKMSASTLPEHNHEEGSRLLRDLPNMCDSYHVDGPRGGKTNRSPQAAHKASCSENRCDHPLRHSTQSNASCPLPFPSITHILTCRYRPPPQNGPTPYYNADPKKNIHGRIAIM